MPNEIELDFNELQAFLADAHVRAYDDYMDKCNPSAHVEAYWISWNPY